MPTTKDRFKAELRSDLEQLLGLRDEIRVKLGVASSELTQEFQQLDPKLTQLEQRIATEGDALGAATADMVADLKKAFFKVRDTLTA